MFTQHIFDENTNQEVSVLDKLISFYFAPDPQLKDGKKLDVVLGGYLNKIISYWLIKDPDYIMDYVTETSRRFELIDCMFSHLYLSNCVTDLIVRFCTIP
jgi:hypothetical protein